MPLDEAMQGAIININTLEFNRNKTINENRPCVGHLGSEEKTMGEKSSS